MSEPEHPAVTFGQEIRYARETRGWSQATLADKLCCQQPYVSKVERGAQLASATFAEQCDKVFGTPGVYARMRERAADAGNPAWLVPYLQLEREAATVCDYSPVLVAGILQTPEYAEAVYRSARPDDSVLSIKQRVEDRMRRKEVFDRPNPPSFWVILQEAVLWSGLGGADVMRGQLEHLVAVSEHPSITVQVLPFGGTPVRGTPFILLRQQDGTEVLYAENYVQEQVHDSPEAIAEARATYERLRANALSLPDSLSLIRHVMEAYRHEHHPRPHPRDMGEVQLQRRQRRNLRRMGPHIRLWHRPRP
ncbi:helix-turn-helix domain-containing protein [Streptomyces orinoci]|uniref:Helix-turn-helix transcriptional regulator n=1 Tax=Streptomyces orinoci TaxID=67339 RepID=A0ABV3JPV0_STRON|nr:helix-turn-helix transcriptional regulator [Streptomyces orinoci]